MTLQRDAQNKIQMAIITCFNPPKYYDRNYKGGIDESKIK